MDEPTNMNTIEDLKKNTLSKSVEVVSLEVLACPACQGALIWHSIDHEKYYCRHCQLTYPIIDGQIFLRPEDGEKAISPK